MEDDDFGSEFGSVISLQSLDDSSAYQEKPKQIKKSRSRDHQPYLSQSSGSLNTRSGPRKTGHEAWSSAIRNGFTGLSSENSPANRMGLPQRKTKNRSSASAGPFSRDEHTLASGKPAYKSPEDYYDEIMELRQVIKGLKNDNGVLKTKLQRITQENVLKDRQIKDFLNPNKQPDEIRRTLTDKNSDSSAVVSSLKQKIHLMERNVKDKENELRKLKSDLKSTHIDELRIQMETYYEETQRLQAVLSSVYSQVPGTRNISDSRSNGSRSSSAANTPRRGGQERTDEYHEQLTYENRRLKSENQSLKKDLLCAIDSQRNKDNTTKNKNVDYADMNRLQMLRKIGELEEALEDAKGKGKQKSGPKESKRSDEDSETELRKQRGVIENLKQDRAHYREEAEGLREKLEAAEDEISELRSKLRKANEENKEWLAKDESRYDLKKEDKASSTVSPPRPTPKQRNKTGSMKKKISFHEDTVKDEKQRAKFSREEDEAARVLQRNWKSYNNKKYSPRDDDIVRLQSALRAHAIRRRHIELLSNDEVEQDLEWDDAVTRVQSAMRGHHARRKYYSNAEKYSRDWSRSEDSDESDIAKKQEKKRSFKQQSFLKKSQSDRRIAEPSHARSLLADKDDSTDDDSDDDVVIGGSRLNLRNEGKKFSTFTDEAPVRGKKSSTTIENSQSRATRKGWKKEINSDDSDDDSVQLPTRFGKSVPPSKDKTPHKNGFSFDNAPRKNVDEQKLRNFFGKESEEKDGPRNNGAKTESSLDNFFTSSRASKVLQSFDSQAGSEPEGEANSQEKGKNEIVEEKPKKSLFSWGSTKRNNKNVPVPPPRKKTTPDEASSKSANVWSSRPSATFGDEDDDDDDDVIVTPKISRKNPTKTASLLDELF